MKKSSQNEKWIVNWVNGLRDRTSSKLELEEIFADVSLSIIFTCMKEIDEADTPHGKDLCKN